MPLPRFPLPPAHGPVPLSPAPTHLRSPATLRPFEGSAAAGQQPALLGGGGEGGSLGGREDQLPMRDECNAS
jgi:hypothetical protein